MDILDQLLAEAAADAASRKRTKSATSAAPIPEDRAALFLVHRQVALYYRTTCHHCGTVADEFDGLFEERKHVRLPDLHLVRQPFLPIDNDLPRVRRFLPRDVPYCAACSNLDRYKEE